MSKRVDDLAQLVAGFEKYRNPLSRPNGKRADVLIMDDVEERKMKFAPVAPYHIYQQFIVNGYVPNTVLLLAHDVVSHEDEYAETFMHKAWNDTTIIMDNSLVETGGAVDLEMVKRASEIVAADIVVLPDVMGHGVKSAEATIAAWASWSWEFRNQEKMVVLHGATNEEWFQSAEMIKSEGIDPDWLSIPRFCENGADRRLKLINYARMIFGAKPIHLLGFSNFVGSDLLAASHYNVKSIDSAVPLRLKTTAIISEDAGKRDPHWFRDVKFDTKMIEACHLVDQYINNL